ncbi:hypothetical protein [Carnimonas nigrificans]|uniref:hypothetical protein n=1 Tax=Carnimonas nigrificans TaxID=64323 RepID=UPI00046F9899|nr:hypothetical protein [Carnimonas nigrificans]
MRKLAVALVLLVVLNLGVAAGFAGFLHSPAETPQTLRIAGALPDGGYRLTLPGKYSSEQVESLKQALDQAFAAQQLEHTAQSAAALLASSAESASSTRVQWYVDGREACPLRPLAESAPAPVTDEAVRADDEAEHVVPRYQWLPHACAPEPTPFAAVQQQRYRQAAFANERQNAVVAVLEAFHLSDYRIEINGVMRARGGHWRVGLPTGTSVTIDHRTLASVEWGKAGRLWVLAPSSQQALRAAAVLAALPVQQAVEVANAHEWRALWTWRDGHTMMSDKFSVQLLP